MGVVVGKKKKKDFCSFFILCQPDVLVAVSIFAPLYLSPQIVFVVLPYLLVWNITRDALL